jgi:tRNA1Val (adenine37-N6)-methyltransferase
MKSSVHFHFKKFSIAQDACTHKVGTDGVLLGAWANVKDSKTILEIGTGSGVIALMLAQRTDLDTTIEAIEIEEADAKQASENVKQSPWAGKITIHHTAAQQFSSQKKYDLIVSNPPFFINSSLPPVEKRGQARHTHSLSFTELLEISKKFLAEHGRLAVILPTVEGQGFIELAKTIQLHCIRQGNFYTRKHKPVERLLLEFELNQPYTEKEETDILLYDGNEWSQGYQNLTREFYLKI